MSSFPFFFLCTFATCLAVSRSTSMRRLTNSRDRSVLPRSILLLFLSPFFFICFSRFSTKSQAQRFIAPSLPPSLPPGEMSSHRSRGARSKSSLYPFLHKLGSATRSRNRRLRIAPELDKILLRKKKNACRVFDIHTYNFPFPCMVPTKLFLSSTPSLATWTPQECISSAWISQKRNRRARKNNVQPVKRHY